jgi:hypothetical protein
MHPDLKKYEDELTNLIQKIRGTIVLNYTNEINENQIVNDQSSFSLLLHFQDITKSCNKWEKLFKKYESSIEFAWINESFAFIHSQYPIVGITLKINLIEYVPFKQTIPIIEYCPTTMIEYIEQNIHDNNRTNEKTKKLNLELHLKLKERLSNYNQLEKIYLTLQQRYDVLNSEFDMYRKNHNIIEQLFDSYLSKKESNINIEELKKESNINKKELKKENNITKLEKEIDSAIEDDDLYGNSNYQDYIQP